MRAPFAGAWSTVRRVIRCQRLSVIPVFAAPKKIRIRQHPPGGPPEFRAERSAWPVPRVTGNIRNRVRKAWPGASTQSSLRTSSNWRSPSWSADAGTDFPDAVRMFCGDAEDQPSRSFSRNSWRTTGGCLTYPAHSWWANGEDLRRWHRITRGTVTTAPENGGAHQA